LRKRPETDRLFAEQLGMKTEVVLCHVQNSLKQNFTDVCAVICCTTSAQAIHS